MIVLVASELGPLPPTILLRCQLVPFRGSERAVRGRITQRAPERSETKSAPFSRAAGRPDRAPPLDSAAADRRETLIAAARSAYLEPDFELGEAAAALLATSTRTGRRRRTASRRRSRASTPAREADQRVRRAQRGAERDEIPAGLEALEAWYRDRGRRRLGARAQRRTPTVWRTCARTPPETRGRLAVRCGSRSRDLARARGVQPGMPRLPSKPSSSDFSGSCGVQRTVLGPVGRGDWGRHILRDPAGCL